MRNILISTAIASCLFAGNAQAGIRIEILDPIIVAQIDKTKQRMHVSINGEPVYTWKISTGTARYNTPRGEFTPYRMHTMWYSRKYGNAPMPHAVFFHLGYAVHGTNSIGRLGSPASHGCIRLHPANARKFFQLVQEHGGARTQVAITGSLRAPSGKSAKVKRKRKKRFSHRRRALDIN